MFDEFLELIRFIHETGANVVRSVRGAAEDRKLYTHREASLLTVTETPLSMRFLQFDNKVISSRVQPSRVEGTAINGSQLGPLREHPFG